MKTKHLINLFYLFAVIPAFAQETGAQINFETTTIDYGTIANGSDGERVFNFTNSGNKDLIIQNVQSSCGCTIPKKPEGPITPGESSEIIVKYDTKRTGPFRKTITVTTNLEQNSIVALKIKGTVLPKE